MATINFPPPSAVLNSPAPIAPPTPSQISIKPRTKSHSQKKSASVKSVKASNKVQNNTIAKPKQSKSRNGCVTCKAKRLKCDETKPTCQQCERRSVTCGGYKKDFKWRSFEENSFSGKTTLKVRKDTPTPPDSATEPTFPLNHSKASQATSAPEAHHGSLQSPELDIDTQQISHTFENVLPTPPEFQSANFSTNAMYGHITENYQQPSPVLSQETYVLYPTHGNFRSDANTNNGYHNNGAHSRPHELPQDEPKAESMFTPGHSPRLEDLLLPGTDMNQPPPAIDLRPPQSPRPYQPSGWSPPQMNIEMTVDPNEDVEEILRPAGWHGYRSPSPTQSESSTSSSSSIKLYHSPVVAASSPESLLRRFANDTCGILSVKDGDSENPWRNLIGPLAHDSPALMNAILSMTAFHSSQADPKLRLTAVTTMNDSIRDLITNMSNIKLDTALATTIVLAFAEGWDRHTSTGIEHLRGSKALLDKAVKNKDTFNADELTRLRFLSNTWIYMDVIARLTSFHQDESSTIDNVADLEGVMSSLSQHPSDAVWEVDPLMGCASTLFPIIGRVASLVQRRRRGEPYSFRLMEQAVELKEQIERWKLPGMHHFEEPEDQNSQVQHSFQTADAYRYATLLYLHQAVPEIPSQSSARLANNVLHCLATVPVSSRTTIVHIFPLLAAGCELRLHEERKWVEERWDIMSKRMRIGNVDKCIEVTKEVWRRRDEFEATRSLRSTRKSGHGTTIRRDSDTLMDGARNFSDRKRRASTLDEPGENGATTDVRNHTRTDDFGVPRFKKRAPANGFGNSIATGLSSPQISSSIRLPMPPSPHQPRAPPDIGLEQLEAGYTVRGPLHWSSVMKDYGWEVFVG